MNDIDRKAILDSVEREYRRAESAYLVAKARGERNPRFRDDFGIAKVVYQDAKRPSPRKRDLSRGVQNVTGMDMSHVGERVVPSSDVAREVGKFRPVREVESVEVTRTYGAKFDDPSYRRTKRVKRDGRSSKPSRSTSVSSLTWDEGVKSQTVEFGRSVKKSRSSKMRKRERGAVRETETRALSHVGDIRPGVRVLHLSRKQREAFTQWVSAAVERGVVESQGRLSALLRLSGSKVSIGLFSVEELRAMGRMYVDGMVLRGVSSKVAVQLKALLVK